MKTLWEKIQAEFNELKTKLSGQTPNPQSAAEVAKLTASIEAGQTENAAQAKSIEAKDKEIADLKKTLADKDSAITAKDKEIADLKAEAKTAGEKAANLLAAAGIKLEDLPEAKPEDSANKGGKAKSLKAQYLELQAKDSVAAAKFYAENSQKPEFWKG